MHAAERWKGKTGFKSSVASAKNDLDPRSPLFQPGTEATRWCKWLPLLLSCLGIALFLLLACWFSGACSILGKKEGRSRVRGWGGVGGQGELSEGVPWLQNGGQVKHQVVSWGRLGNQFSFSCCNAAWHVGNQCNAKRSNSPQRFQEALSEATDWIYGHQMKQKVLERISLCLGAVVSVDDVCPGTSPVIIISSISQLLSLTCIIQMFHIIPDSNLEYECSGLLIFGFTFFF